MSDWFPAGGGQGGSGEIAYVALAAGTGVPISGTSSATATSIVDSGSVPFPGGDVDVEFFSPSVFMEGVVGGTMEIGLFEAGTLITVLCYLETVSTTHLQLPVYGRYRFAPSAGDHTYTVAAWVSSTTGTPSVGGGFGDGFSAPVSLLLAAV